MSEPFNLDDALGDGASQPFRFVWGGQDFTLPPVMSLDIERQLAIVATIENLSDRSDAGTLLAAIKLVVGDELLAQMQAAKPASAVAMIRLIQAWTQHQGGELGKSPASDASSASTAARSKRT